MAQAMQPATMDPLQMIMRAADTIGDTAMNAIGGAIGFAAQRAPGAVSSTFGAGVQLVDGINDAVRGAAESITPATSAASNPFEGLNLGGALAGLRGCSMSGNCNELGEMASPLANLAQMRNVGGYSMSA